MKAFERLQKRFVRTLWQTGYIAAIVVASMVALPGLTNAAQIMPPAVPEALEVPEGHVPYLVGYAVGTQNYICLPKEGGVAYKLFTPQANLYNDIVKQKQITTHFFSPNPFENGTIRATWQDSKGTSTVWGEVKQGHNSSDPAFVAPGAIPWLLVTIVGAQDGPTGGDALTETTYIHRVNTAGGIAPATGCSSTADIGVQAFVPYTTDYIFYRSAEK